jgi:protocatechuate 3,4-dioxygenase, beta subunit
MGDQQEHHGVEEMPKPGDYNQRDRLWQPPGLTQNYKSSVTRSPSQPLLSLPQTMSEITGPVFGHGDIDPIDNDLLSNFAKTGLPIGERMILHGRVLDENGRPVPKTLVEIWQANAGGRYRHRNDIYLAPIDPNFGGCGRTITDETGYYFFRTVKPGAYPFRNWINSWRPAHIHISVFGSSFSQRLITQMYFEGDPLIRSCPIVNAVSDPKAVAQLIAALDLNAAEPMDCLAYRFDIILRGRRSTLFENRLEGN